MAEQQKSDLTCPNCGQNQIHSDCFSQKPIPHRALLKEAIVIAHCTNCWKNFEITYYVSFHTVTKGKA